jgi:hypothetical protein
MNLMHPDHQLALIQNQQSVDRRLASHAATAKSVDRRTAPTDRAWAVWRSIEPCWLQNRRCRNAECGGLAH